MEGSLATQLNPGVCSSDKAWLQGSLDRTLTVGGGKNMLGSITFATYSVSDSGSNYLKKGENDPVLLPVSKHS